jgi:hypothetical protein
MPGEPSRAKYFPPVRGLPAPSTVQRTLLPTIANSLIAGPNRGRGSAPPVYRPNNALPSVRTAQLPSSPQSRGWQAHGPRPTEIVQAKLAPAVRGHNAPKAPPVYRPEPIQVRTQPIRVRTQPGQSEQMSKVVMRRSGGSVQRMQSGGGGYPLRWRVRRLSSLPWWRVRRLSSPLRWRVWRLSSTLRRRQFLRGPARPDAYGSRDRFQFAHTE